MPTTTPLTDAINALTRYANDTTGASDTNLSDAVATLVAGYGQGGGGSDPLTEYLAEQTKTVSYTSETGRKALPANMFDGYPLESIDARAITSLGAYAFSNCTSLTSVNLPNVTTIGAHVFQGCTHLQLLHLPKLTSITGTNNYSFDFKNTSSRRAVLVLPSLATVQSDLFRGSTTYFSKVDIGPNFHSIPARMFYQAHFTDVIFRSATMVTLTNTNGAGVGASDGLANAKIYVPQAVISDYEANSTWASAKSSKAFTYHAIEGSEYEYYYADGTPIE